MAEVSEALRKRLLSDWHSWQDVAHLMTYDGFSALCDPEAPLAPGAASVDYGLRTSEWLAPPEGTPARPHDLLNWVCAVPGPAGTPWEGARLPFVLRFDERYPAHPPTARFLPGFFHPNVYPSGKVCAPFLSHEKNTSLETSWPPAVAWTWHPKATVQEVLQAISALLGAPYNRDAAQEPAWRVLDRSTTEYEARVRAPKPQNPTNVKI